MRSLENLNNSPATGVQKFLCIVQQHYLWLTHSFGPLLNGCWPGTPLLRAVPWYAMLQGTGWGRWLQEVNTVHSAPTAFVYPQQSINLCMF